MLRGLAFVAAAVLFLLTASSVPAAQFGTAEEAKAMLERAVAAVKEDKAKAIDMFNKGADGFKDRDLYVFCANASDGIVTAHPYGQRGKQLREIFRKKGYPLGQEIMQKATEGTMREVTYWWSAQTRRWRRPHSTRKLVIRFAVSATTRNERGKLLTAERAAGVRPARPNGSQPNGESAARVSSIARAYPSEPISELR